jgi:NAD(P)-dependent dehydrogenase (short-subunit alcohol dehydrogenase family)
VSATFEGQTCLVSGAGSGIGAATPILLAERGASVGLVGLATDPLDDVAETIRATGGRAMSLPADVADATEIAHAVSVTETAFGPLTMAVNSAGVAGSEVEPHEDSVGDWNHVMGVNLSGAFFSLRAEAGAMLLAGSGSIVNIASVHTIHTLPHRAAYTASKHGSTPYRPGPRIRRCWRREAISHVGRSLECRGVAWPTPQRSPVRRIPPLQRGFVRNRR